jgi:hypothetical protein
LWFTAQKVVQQATQLYITAWGSGSVQLQAKKGSELCLWFTAQKVVQ